VHCHLPGRLTLHPPAATLTHHVAKWLLPALPGLQEGVEPLGSDAWGMARVLAGRPAPGSELTEDFNPLEAGLYRAVSVSKGCYIGQETIAKVGAGGWVLVALVCVWQELVCGWVMGWQWVGDGERGP
jgi:folate-binding protein YgfZ